MPPLQSTTNSLLSSRPPKVKICKLLESALGLALAAGALREVRLGSTNGRLRGVWRSTMPFNDGKKQTAFVVGYSF